MGLFVWYFGTSRTYPDVEHHTIIMGRAFKELEDIYDKKILSDDLSLYLHRPAATDASMAPENKDAFMFLHQFPINWPRSTGRRLASESCTSASPVGADLASRLGDCLEVSHFVTPDDFEGNLILCGAVDFR